MNISHPGYSSEWSIAFLSTGAFRRLVILVASVCAWSNHCPMRAAGVFRAGAFAQDISPTQFPASVNGGRKASFADSIHDPMHARSMVLSDGRHEIVVAPARPPRAPGEQIGIVARSLADAAKAAYDTIKWETNTTLDSQEVNVRLKVRKASPTELEDAKRIVATPPRDRDGQWDDRRAIYAREAIKLAEFPDEMPVNLQVHRIGNLSIAATSAETFVEIGLEWKKLSPFQGHFTLSLANGYSGYLPTPEQHAFGGYETWRARTSYLETRASVKLTERLEVMLASLKERAR